MFLVLEISAFELVAVNSPGSNENTCNRNLFCEKTVLTNQM